MSELLSEADFRQVVQRANLAPSVHNTQPTRWKRDGDSAILLCLDRTRRLDVADPQGRDARLSCGTALEGTRLALSEFGFGVRGVELMPSTDEGSLQPVVRIEVKPGDAAMPLCASVPHRFTWRGGFVPATGEAAKTIADIAAGSDDATAVVAKAEIERLAAMNDAASLAFFRQKPYRTELLKWMRLSKGDPNWAVDGMNASALGMTGLEALGARFVLRAPLFGILDTLGMSGSLVSEGTKTKSAAGVILFHRPEDEDPLDNGVAFYRLLLSLTAQGLAAWPMAVLADNPECRDEIVRRHGVPGDRRLLNVLRVGKMPEGAKPGRARLDVQRLILG